MVGVGTQEGKKNLEGWGEHARGQTTSGQQGWGEQSNLTPSVFKAVLQKSISTQIRQLIYHINHSKGSVDGLGGGG